MFLIIFVFIPLKYISISTNNISVRYIFLLKTIIFEKKDIECLKIHRESQGRDLRITLRLYTNNYRKNNWFSAIFWRRILLKENIKKSELLNFSDEIGAMGYVINWKGDFDFLKKGK